LANTAEELRQPHYQWMVRSRRAALALLAGRLAEAKRLIGQAVALAERMRRMSTKRHATRRSWYS
jgi:hypothetical protein